NQKLLANIKFYKFLTCPNLWLSLSVSFLRKTTAICGLSFMLETDSKKCTVWPPRYFLHFRLRV
ncbi:MAG: hypothetical protein ACOCZX_04805, partial [Candidatus Bipolaricaulota bacterium]